MATSCRTVLVLMLAVVVPVATRCLDHGQAGLHEDLTILFDVGVRGEALHEKGGQLPELYSARLRDHDGHRLIREAALLSHRAHNG